MILDCPLNETAYMMSAKAGTILGDRELASTPTKIGEDLRIPLDESDDNAMCQLEVPDVVAEGATMMEDPDILQKGECGEGQGGARISIRMSLSEPGSSAPNAGDHAGPADPDGGEEHTNALLMSEPLELKCWIMRALTLRQI